MTWCISSSSTPGTWASTIATRCHWPGSAVGWPSSGKGLTSVLRLERRERWARSRGCRMRNLEEGRPLVPNVNVTYAEMQSAARQLQAGEQTMEGDLSKLKRLVDNLVAGGYVTDASSRQFEASYTQFNSGATKMIQGLNGMGQYLDAAVKAFHDTDTQLAASLKQ